MAKKALLALVSLILLFASASFASASYYGGYYNYPAYGGLVRQSSTHFDRTISARYLPDGSLEKRTVFSLTTFESPRYSSSQRYNNYYPSSYYGNYYGNYYSDYYQPWYVKYWDTPSYARYYQYSYPGNYY